MLEETDKSFLCCYSSATFNFNKMTLDAVFRPILRVKKPPINVSSLQLGGIETFSPLRHILIWGIETF